MDGLLLRPRRSSNRSPVPARLACLVIVPLAMFHLLLAGERSPAAAAESVAGEELERQLKEWTQEAMVAWIKEGLPVAGQQGLDGARKLGGAEPIYPGKALAARIDGHVLLRVQIRADGDVKQVKVIRCTRPGEGFEQAAVAAVKNWRFAPVLRDHRPVMAYQPVLVSFQPEDAQRRAEEEVRRREVERQARLEQIVQHCEELPDPEDYESDRLKPPRLIRKKSPRFPAEAGAAGVGGRVILIAVIDRMGTMKALEVRDATEPDLGFSKAAHAAVSGWVYEAGRLDGEAVDLCTNIQVNFTKPPADD